MPMASSWWFTVLIFSLQSVTIKYPEYQLHNLMYNFRSAGSPSSTTSKSMVCPMHQNQKRSWLCLQNQCYTDSVLCPSCLAETHQNHETILLRDFFTKMEELRCDQSVVRLASDTLQQLEQYRFNCIEMMENTRKTIAANIADSERKITVFFNNLETSLVNEVNKYTHWVSGYLAPTRQQLSQNKVKDDLRKYLEASHQQEAITNQILDFNKSAGHLQWERMKVLRSFLEMIHTTHHQVTHSLKKQDFILNKALTQQKVVEFDQPKDKKTQPKMTWDNDLKHVDITVDGHKAYRVRRISDCAGVLGMPLQEEIEWKIKVDSAGSYGIYVGICLESVAKWYAFQRGDWSSPGHGHYLLGSQGHTVSHQDMSINFKPLGYCFYSGDVIKVSYQPNSRKLRLVKNNTKVWQFVINRAPMGDYYRPCVYLREVGDCVQFLEDQKTQYQNEVGSS